ncbi:recombinase family protein [Kutzneria buriramensis]|uniref:Recombinase n=1 Tax=Kutzneria buriramensis TaxID=1045776 RepID=A0A3E0HP33_9PSEU|nr:recombinase family protein [Kutzneria buriramensis]REH48273.1 recombinase [Kutzneria buriramensis]
MTPKRNVSAGQDAARPVTLDSYGRLSRVPETGELEKIDVQWADNRKVVERVGARLGQELQDGLSAWKRGVRRPGWEALLERVESGVVDGVVVWHTDRLFRQPRDLEKLIELGERGFKVYSAHGTRDLSDPDDRFILRIEVAHAARSSDDTARRIKRRFATFREQGKGTGGPRRFGFPGKDLTWTPGPGQTKDDQPLVSADQVARERQAIRDAAEAVLTGVSMCEIARQWNAAGLRTAAGRNWVQVTVRDTLKRPTLAGVIEHEGKPVGRLPGEPILSQRTFDRVRALIAGRKRGRVAGERYVGTGLLRCGKCFHKLSAHVQTGKTYKDGTKRFDYFCCKQHRGCGGVYADGGSVDRELRTFTINRLSDDRHAAAIAAARARVADRLAEVNDEIDDIERLHQALSARLGARQMTLDAFDAANEPLVADLARLTAEREALSGGNADGPTQAQSPEEVARQWDAGGFAEKRSLLTQALGRNWMMVEPFTQSGRKRFNPRRVHPVKPKSAAEVAARAAEVAAEMAARAAAQ